MTEDSTVHVFSPFFEKQREAGAGESEATGGQRKQVGCCYGV